MPSCAWRGRAVTEVGREQLQREQVQEGRVPRIAGAPRLGGADQKEAGQGRWFCVYQAACAPSLLAVASPLFPLPLTSPPPFITPRHSLHPAACLGP